MGSVTRKNTGDKPPAKKSNRKTTRKAAARKPARKAAGKKTAAKAPSRVPPDLEVDPDVLELIEAIDGYKKSHNRPFPSWSEVLYVLRKLGYTKD